MNIITVSKIYLLVLLCLFAVACDSGPSPEEHYAIAADARATGYLDVATIELKNVLSEQPENADARYLLANCYLDIGDGESARKEFEKAGEFGLDPALVEQGVISSTVLLEQYEAALERIDNRTLSMDREFIANARGEALLHLGRVDDAAEEFNSALKWDPDNVAAILGLAQVDYERGDSVAAQEKMRVATEKEPKNFDAQLFNAQLMLLLGKNKQAIDSAKRATELRSPHQLAMLTLSQALIKDRSYDDAIKQLKALTQRSPGNLEAQYYLAEAYYHKKEVTVAYDGLRVVAAKAPNHLPTNVLLALSLLHLQEVEQAQEVLSRVYSRHPNHVGVRSLLGVVKLEQGKPSEAVELLEPVIRAYPENTTIRGVLGNAYLASGQYDRASELFLLSIDEQPSDAATRTQLALSYAAEGLTDRVIKELRTAYETDPDYHRAGLLLSIAHMRRGESAEALSIAQQLSERSSASPIAPTLQGMVMERDGNIEMAVGYYEEALRRDANFSPAELRLGWIKVQQSDANAAAGKFERVASRDEGNLEALLALARINAEAGDEKKKIERLKQARSSNPDSFNSRILLLDRYLRDGDFSSALPVAHEAVALGPRHAGALLGLAKAQNMTGDPTSAVETLQKLISLYPEQPDAYIDLARITWRFGDVGAASSLMDRYLVLKPDDLKGWVTQANMNLEANPPNPRKALELSEIIARDFPETSERHAIRARAFIIEQKYDEAQKEAEELKQKEPDSSLPPMLSGDAFYAAGDFATARDKYLECLEKDSSSTEALLRIGRLDARAGRLKKAQNFFERVRADERAGAKQSAEASMALSVIARQQGEFEKSKQFADDAVKLDGNNLEILLPAANEARYGGRNVHAQILLERGIKFYPDAVSPQSRLIDFVLARGQLRYAGDLIRQASQKSSTNPLIASAQIKLEALEGRYEKARAGAEALLASTNGSLGSLMLAAWVASESGDYDQAATFYSRAAGATSNPNSVKLSAARTLVNANADDYAQQFLDDVASERANDPALMVLQGQIELQSNRFPEALNYYEKAYAAAPGVATVTALSGALWRASKEHESLDVLSSWLKENPSSISAWLELAEKQYRIGQTTEAFTSYENILRQEPANVVALNSYALKRLTAAPEEALTLAESAIAIEEDNPVVIDTHGWILLKLGKTALGIEEFRRALRFQNRLNELGVVTVKYHLAVALTRIGDTREAVKLLDDVLSESVEFSEKDRAQKLRDSIRI